jgi:solute carrier family 13 (sodium-dependent dicarboxylate transporter), member 2/3/5
MGEVTAIPSLGQKPDELLTTYKLVGAALGPISGLLIWVLPLGLAPAAHKAFAILAFVLVYWATEPIEQGITALFGCFLFWASHATTFAVAFSGFTSNVPWFVFAALLMGQAASRTGLAPRLGYLVLQRSGHSYSRVLFGLIILALLLQFLVPSPHAQISMLAPLAIGVVAAFKLGPRSTMATGMFIAPTFASYLFSRMFLTGGPAMLTRGLIEGQTGMPLLWSLWAIAFLPVTLLTMAACWATVYWLYPPETPELPGGQRYLQEALRAMGPWSWAERKALFWFLLAVALWATDFLHHTEATLIGVGIGLILTLPKVGVLNTTAIKEVNFLQVILLGGALSLGNVLLATHALTIITDGMSAWMVPLLTRPLSAALSLYWGGFLYHFLIPNPSAMVSTGLPVLLDVATARGYNPVALGLIWHFATVSTLFIYQAGSFVLAYSYGYFDGAGARLLATHRLAVGDAPRTLTE